MKREFILFFISILLITLASYFAHDNIFAILAAFFGIIYTILAGKGKVICFLSGIISTVLYAYLAFQNGFWANFILYALYYIPAQILGIFNWKNHLENDTIIKTKFNNTKKIIYFSIGIILSLILASILLQTNDANPYVDSFIVVFSCLAMYFTVLRKIEQWIAWFMVDILAFVLWFQCDSCMSLAISRLIYVFMAVYFYLEWKKQLR